MEMPPKVADKFDTYPDDARAQLLELRQLILDTATATPGVGAIEETLKWGEPAYVTSETKSGSTIRIDWKEKTPDQVAMFFICSTTLVHDMIEAFPGVLKTEEDRAILFDVEKSLPTDTLIACIRMALTYHL